MPMKQARLDGSLASVEDVKEQRNRRLAPEDPDVWQACMNPDCTLESAQLVLNERQAGLQVLLCYCVCHEDPPEREYVLPRFVYPDDRMPPDPTDDAEGDGDLK